MGGKEERVKLKIFSMHQIICGATVPLIFVHGEYSVVRKVVEAHRCTF